jgi:hypothetical protein
MGHLHSTHYSRRVAQFYPRPNYVLSFPSHLHTSLSNHLTAAFSSVSILTGGSEALHVGPVHTFLFSPPNRNRAAVAPLHGSTAPSLERLPSTAPPSRGSRPPRAAGAGGSRPPRCALAGGLYAGELNAVVGAAGSGLPQASSTRGWARPGAQRRRARGR